MLVLGSAAVERIMSPQGWVDQVALAYEEFSSRASNPLLRQRINLSPFFDGRTAFMPGFVGASGALGCKIVGYYPGNAERGRPLVEGIVVLVDPESGAPVAILDGTRLTELRTAAIVAVGIQNFAPDGAPEIGLFGAGALARASLFMLRETCGLERVHVYSRSRESRQRFASEMAERHGLVVTAHDSPEEVLCAAKVIVCATATKEPVFPGALLQQGSLVVSIGANTPDSRELDEDSIRSGTLIVESREATLAECGEVIIPINSGHFGPDVIQAEIGEIIAGTKPKPCPGQTVLFKSSGLAVQDLAVARELVRRAEVVGEGQHIHLD